MDKKTVTFLKVDKPTATGTIYPADVMEKALEEYRQRIERGDAFGGLDPCTPRPRLEDVSHRVTDVRLDGSDVKATVEVLDTPNGRILRQLLDCGRDHFTVAGFGKKDGDTVEEFHLSHVSFDPNGGDDPRE